MNIGLAWKILLVWFCIAAFILFLENAWGILAYAVSFGVFYGGIVYLLRKRVREFFSRLVRGRFPVFLALALVVSVLEELYVYWLGNKIAVSNIWLDIVVVPLEWAAWFSGWYFMVSKWYRFDEKEALLVAGTSGILFEYSGKGFLLSDPIAMLLFFPIAVVVYSAIFILPMQLIEFRGNRNTWIKFPVGVILPYLLSIPVGLALYFTLIA